MARKFVTRPRELREIVRRELSRADGGETLCDHLRNSAEHRHGDEATLAMLSASEFDHDLMYGWLTLYKTTICAARKDVGRILRTIRQNWKAWRRLRGSPRDLVGRIHSDLRTKGRPNRFVMATKIAWLVRPYDVTIFDSLVERALKDLSRRKILAVPISIQRDRRNLDGNEGHSLTLRGYGEFDEVLREIAHVCSKELDHYLRSECQALLPALKNNRLRLLDKLLWVRGRRLAKIASM